MTLHEKGIPYKFIPVNFAAGENKSPEFLVMSPFGKVPVYVGDDGMVLSESRAICRYIALKWRDEGTRLVPDNWDLAGRTEDGEGIGGWVRFENVSFVTLIDFDFEGCFLCWSRVVGVTEGQTKEGKLKLKLNKRKMEGEKAIRMEGEKRRRMELIKEIKEQDAN